jgi:hypothetical protein
MNIESKALEQGPRGQIIGGGPVVMSQEECQLRTIIEQQHTALQDLQTECTALRVNEENLTAQVESLRAQLAARVPDMSEALRVLHCIETSVVSGINVTDGWRILRNLLSAAPSQQAPVAQGEPVAEVVMAAKPPKASQAWLPFKIVHASLQWLDSVPTGTKLYTHPQQASEPMTDAQAYTGSLLPKDLRSSQPADWFLSGVRFAERHHNIKGKQ